MTKKIPNQSTRPVAKRGVGYAKLVKAISQVNTDMVGRAAVAVNQALVLRNWLIGAYIVEFEQNGADRARYGERLLPTLAEDLKAQGIKGMGPEVLRTSRLFFLSYPEISHSLDWKLQLWPEWISISHPVGGKLGHGMSGPVADPAEDQVAALPTGRTLCNPSGKTSLAARQAESGESPSPLSPQELLRFSWAHFLELIRIEDPWKRAFYENELLRGHWSKRQLQRQIGSLLYERTALSTNKRAVIERARKQEPQETIAEMLRDPYILEFTGLSERYDYSEGELETALLDHLQRFLLELGHGFCFEARQFRMTEGRKHHRVDLVFYHRILRCHVLIDLKIRSFKPEDAGQMNFYVNWFKANMMHEGDNPPVGILLCSDKDGTEVEFATAGMDQKLFVSRYLVALPSVEKLRRFLEADRERIESHIAWGAALYATKARKRAPRKSKS
jgi:predicted nuclease of restriction endonuclease-like (RecB) superfamily